MGAEAVADVDVQRSAAAPGAPSDAELVRAAEAVLAAEKSSGALSLCLVASDVIADMNARYRGKQGATNVLSFPQDVRDENDVALLGDVLLCPDVIEREAREQGKPPAHHYLHMVIHGVLHLLGHDHIQPAEADAMETRERALLAGFAIPDPYGDPMHHTSITEHRTATDG